MFMCVQLHEASSVDADLLVHLNGCSCVARVAPSAFSVMQHDLLTYATHATAHSQRISL